MNSVDCFVFLDDVQVERQSWQTRNRICLSGREQMLTVPVQKTGLDTKVMDACVDDSKHWRKKHAKTLRQAYSSAAYGELIVNSLEMILDDRAHNTLADINIAIIICIAGILGLDPRFLRASALNCGNKRSEHLIEICQRIDATSYISPEGSRTYLKEDGFTDRLGDTPMRFHRFVPGPYKQAKCKKFIPFLSVADVIANLGPDAARSYLKEHAEYV